MHSQQNIKKKVQLRSNHAIHCYCAAAVYSSCLKSVLQYKLLIFDTYHPHTLYIYVSKDVRNHCYIWKAKGVRQQSNVGNAAVNVRPSWGWICSWKAVR